MFNNLNVDKVIVGTLSNHQGWTAVRSAIQREQDALANKLIVRNFENIVDLTVVQTKLRTLTALVTAVENQFDRRK